MVVRGKEVFLDMKAYIAFNNFSIDFVYRSNNLFF